MDDALCWISGATQSAEWLGSRPGRDLAGTQVLNAIRRFTLRLLYSNRRLTGLEHRMHDTAKFAPRPRPLV